MVLTAMPLLGCQTLLLGRISDGASDSDDAGTTATAESASGGVTSGGSTADCSDTGCEPCIEYEYLECFYDAVYWFDSCGVAHDIYEPCGGDGCEAGACKLPCTPTYTVVANECDDFFTESDGAGPGGGESMIICATTNEQTGHMTIKVHKRPGDPEPVFDDRRYHVRVSQLADGDCGPDTFYFDVADDSPVGAGTTELAFSFPATWLADQATKAYCVTAAMQPGDMDYEPFNAGKLAWWWSDKIEVSQSQCN